MFKRVLAVIGIITTMVSAEIWEWGWNCVENNYGSHKYEIGGITCITIATMAQLQCLNCEKLLDDWYDMACGGMYFHSFSNPANCQTPCANCGVKYSESNVFNCMVSGDGSGAIRGHKLGECGEDNFCRVDGCSFLGRTEHQLSIRAVKNPGTCQVRSVVDKRCNFGTCYKIFENVEHDFAPHTNNTCGKCDNCDNNTHPEHNWGEEPHNCFTRCSNEDRISGRWCGMLYSQYNPSVHNYTGGQWTPLIISANCARNGVERGRCTNRHDIYEYWICEVEIFRTSAKKECVNADCNICGRGEITALQGIVGDLETQLDKDTLRLLGVISARDGTIKDLNTKVSDLEADTATLAGNVRTLTSERDQLKLDTAQLHKDTLRLFNANTTLAGHVSNLSNERNNLQGHVSTLTTSNISLQGQVLTLTSTNTTLTTNNATLVGQVSALSTEKSALELTITQRNTTISQQNTKISDLEDEIERLLEELQDCGKVSNNVIRSDNNHGIRFAQNIVSERAEISVVLPASTGSATAVETKVVIYDMTGNVVWASTASTGSATGAAGLSWDLRNSAGRFVANGTYLVIAEVKDRNGRTHTYSARLGVKR